jgi:hypothetical protein
MAAPVFFGPRKGKSESWFAVDVDVAVLEMDREVESVFGWDALAAKSVTDEPLLSVCVAIVFEVVVAVTSAPNGTVVAADSGSDIDV